MSGFIYDDGGRAEAGFKGDAGDCVVRAIAIAAEQPYSKVYDELFELNRKNNGKYLLGRNPSPRNGGTATKTIHEYLEVLGWTWVPLMKIGSGCKVHLKADELPKGRIIAKVSHHLVAAIDGVIHDTFDSSRDGTRCVYGYWVKEV